MVARDGRAGYTARMDRYPVLVGPFRVETVVQRSRFICDLAPADTVEAAQAFVAWIRQREPDASHHCYGFVVGPPGSTARIGQSDDGEPHDTAGRPMLNVLLHADLGDVVAVVTRYFGGTKLGKGGLVRAYSGAVVAALSEAATQLKVDWVELTLRADYAYADSLRRLYPRFEVELVNETFEARLVHHLRAPRPRLSALTAAVSDATRGQVQVRAGDEV